MVVVEGNYLMVWEEEMREIVHEMWFINPLVRSIDRYFILSMRDGGLIDCRRGKR